MYNEKIHKDWNRSFPMTLYLLPTFFSFIGSVNLIVESIILIFIHLDFLGNWSSITCISWLICELGRIKTKKIPIQKFRYQSIYCVWIFPWNYNYHFHINITCYSPLIRYEKFTLKIKFRFALCNLFIVLFLLINHLVKHDAFDYICFDCFVLGQCSCGQCKCEY